MVVVILHALHGVLWRMYRRRKGKDTLKNKPICLHLCRKMDWKPALYYIVTLFFFHIDPTFYSLNVECLCMDFHEIHPRVAYDLAHVCISWSVHTNRWRTTHSALCGYYKISFRIFIWVYLNFSEYKQ
jgi:hypothetical protein